MSEPADGVVLRLASDEALVLFEWLHRMEDEEGYASVIEDDAEELALWRLSGLLESELVEPFRPDYRQLVAEARDRVRLKYGG